MKLDKLHLFRKWSDLQKIKSMGFGHINITKDTDTRLRNFFVEVESYTEVNDIKLQKLIIYIDSQPYLIKGKRFYFQHHINLLYARV